MEGRLEALLGELRELRRALDELARGTALLRLLEAADLLANVIKGGGKIIVLGNGGSAAQAQHFAAELAVRFRRERRALPALSLPDPATLTAAANDLGYEKAFSRWVEAVGRPPDALLALSTSGRSENVNAAVRTAKALGMRAVYLAGAQEPPVEADIVITVPTGETPRVQELHQLLLHLLAGEIERLAG